MSILRSFWLLTANSANLAAITIPKEARMTIKARMIDNIFLKNRFVSE
jgi:hypothetical protein